VAKFCLSFWSGKKLQEITLKQLLESGVHFGHQTRRWNPKMKPFIFTERNGIHILDLQETLKKLELARGYARELSKEGHTILFVGTKRQAQETIVEEATKCGMPYVNQRWLGGTMTNFRTIRQRINFLKDLEEEIRSGGLDKYPKKEQLKLQEKHKKLLKFFGGLAQMDRLPSALFIIDLKKEKIALAEALKLGIPTIAVVDSNCDPEPIDFPIPGNDDAIRAIKLFASAISSAVVEGREGRFGEDDLAAEMAASTVETASGEEPTAENVAAAESTEEEASPAPAESGTDDEESAGDEDEKETESSSEDKTESDEDEDEK
jgi:small subunit ribosomal protein S2